MKLAHKVLIALSVLLFIPTPSRAWDKTGHMIVTEIAYGRLKPAARAKVDALAAALNSDPLAVELPAKFKPYTFVSESAFMDDIKILPDAHHFSPWHYIDLPDTGDPPSTVWTTLPATAAAAQSVRDFKPEADSDCYDTIVHKCLPVLRDPHASTADQARMLAFLTHLVGDIHQPLHCIGRDRGGNGVAIAELPGADPDWPVRNLHAFWDGAYRYDVIGGKLTVASLLDVPRPLPDDPQLKQITALALTQLPTNGKLLHDSDPADWAAESNRLACDVIYPPAGTASLSTDYIARAAPLALQRLALAGVRLANLLNDLYAPNAGN